jgi:hypothetical protein
MFCEGENLSAETNLRSRSCIKRLGKAKEGVERKVHGEVWELFLNIKRGDRYSQYCFLNQWLSVDFPKYFQHKCVFTYLAIVYNVFSWKFIQLFCHLVGLCRWFLVKLFLLRYVHHHMAVQPMSGPGLPLWGFLAIIFLRGWIVTPAPNPQPGGPRLRIYDSRRQGDPPIPPGTGYPF